MSAVDKNFNWRKPENCRLSDKDWRKFLRAAQPGYLFFTTGPGVATRINAWFQTKLLGHSPEHLHVNHVGVIGEDGWMYESLMNKGATRDFHIISNVQGAGKLVIGRIRLPHTQDDVKRGLARLDQFLRQSSKRSYDWLSLITFGKWQANNSVICSELATLYLDEVLRLNLDHQLTGDRLVLPRELLGAVIVEFEG